MVPDDREDDKTQTHVVLTAGTEVGHYRIIEKIGAGGMGEVYLAEDTELKRQVALKFLPPHMCQDKDCRARFKREAQAAANLDHPNIVTIHEVSEYRGRPFFAMQHVEGNSLRDLIKDEDLPLGKVINLAIRICEGLGKAHQADIVHRDIKPSNIVLDSDGRPKILDFGLAAIQGTEKLTKSGSTLGTIGYMSPEQIEEHWYHAYLSWAYAGSGQKQDAVIEAKLAMELMPVSESAMTGADLVEYLATAYIMAGEYDLAIEQLEYLLSIPAQVSTQYLAIWPDYAHLRDHPRFQALLEKYSDQPSSN